LAKKDSHDEQLKIGLTALAQAGIATDNPAAPHLAAIKAQLGTSKEADLAVAYLLGKIADRGALDLLLELERASADKEVKKEIKRAYFKLAQKGLAVAVERQDEKKPAPLFEQAPDIEAYMSAVAWKSPWPATSASPKKKAAKLAWRKSI